MRPSLLRGLMFAWLLAALTVSCGAQARKELDESLYDFNLRYRWKQFGEAAFFVDEETRADFLARHQALADRGSVYTADTQVISYDEEQMEAVAILETTHSMLPSQTMLTSRYELHWTRTPEGWRVHWPAIPAKPSKGK